MADGADRDCVTEVTRQGSPPAPLSGDRLRRRPSPGHTRTMDSPTDDSSARLHVASGSLFEAEFGFSRALRFGDRVLVAGTAPIWADGHCPEDVAEQSRR